MPGERVDPPHPMQPVVLAEDGVVRFKENKIVRAMLDTGKLTLDDIAVLPFSDEDRAQLLQLIGYSVSGFGSMSYVSSDAVAAADAAAAELLKR